MNHDHVLSGGGNISNTAAISPPNLPKDHHKDPTSLPKPSSEKRRHSSNNSSGSNGQNSSIGVAADPVISASDVKVLSSSGGAGTSKVDKSLSRLALYQAVSASVKGGEVACNVKSDGLSAPAAKCDSQASEDEKAMSSNAVRDSKSAEARSPKREPKDFSTSAEVKAEPVSPEADNKPDLKDLKTEEKTLKTVHTHSTQLHHSQVSEPSLNNNNNNSSNSNSSSSSSMIMSPPTPLSSPTGAAALSPVAAGPHTKPSAAVSNTLKEDRHYKHAPSSLSSLSPPPPSVHSKPTSDKTEQQHLTIRHPSPERPLTSDAASMTKHSPLKPAKDHHHHHHHHHHQHQHQPKDRKHEGAPSSSSSSSTTTSTSTSTSSDNNNKDRHHASRSERDRDSLSSRHHHEREAERRRPEEKCDRDRERDRKPGVGVGQSAKPEEPSYSRGPAEFQARTEGLPTATAPASVPVPVADPAAFSEYMRALAAGHHGLV